MLHDIEKTIGQFSDAELEMFIEAVSNEKNKRKKNLYDAKVQAVKVALKDLYDTFPQAEITIERQCFECGDWIIIDILGSMDDLKYNLY